MRGRKGLTEAITKQEFIDMYVSGMTFDDIGEKLGAKAEYVKYYFLKNFLGFERFKIKNDRIKRMRGESFD